MCTGTHAKCKEANKKEDKAMCEQQTKTASFEYDKCEWIAGEAPETYPTGL